MRSRSFVMLLATVTLSIGVGATEAGAACADKAGKAPAFNGRALVRVPGLAFASPGDQASPGSSPSANHSVVGLWLTDFLIGNGPDRYDQTFQQFHADGTELMISNGLPPALGNVCVGLWSQVGPRAFQVRHMTWNWNPDGTFAGTFVMAVRLQVDPQGNRYTGTWAADSFDLNGQIIPELHAEGIVRSGRIGLE